MWEKQEVMGEAVRNPRPAREGRVDGVCRRWLFWEGAGKSRGGIQALEQGKAKGCRGQNPGRRGWPEDRVVLGIKKGRMRP